MDPFYGPIIAQIFLKMHRLAYKILKTFPRVIPKHIKASINQGHREFPFRKWKIPPVQRKIPVV